jgi:uncharacterized RDD family membrane protein YckC
MNCRHCGSLLPTGAIFCDKCKRYQTDSGLSPQPGANGAPGSSTELSVSDVGVRLANYLLDSIFAFIFSMIIMFIIAYVIIDLNQSRDVEPIVDAVLNVFSYILFFIYYAVSEILWQRTPAKFITRTKVVALDGSKANVEKILIRSAARLIPFEPFSFLGKRPIGWHDSLSGTIVVPHAYTPEQVKSINIPHTGNQSAKRIGIIVGIIFGIAVLGIVLAIIFATNP